MRGGRVREELGLPAVSACPGERGDDQAGASGHSSEGGSGRLLCFNGPPQYLRRQRMRKTQRHRLQCFNIAPAGPMPQLSRHARECVVSGHISPLCPLGRDRAWGDHDLSRSVFRPSVRGRGSAAGTKKPSGAGAREGGSTGAVSAALPDEVDTLRSREASQPDGCRVEVDCARLYAHRIHSQVRAQAGGLNRNPTMAGVVFPRKAKTTRCGSIAHQCGFWVTAMCLTPRPIPSTCQIIILPLEESLCPCLPRLPKTRKPGRSNKRAC